MASSIPKIWLSVIASTVKNCIDRLLKGNPPRHYALYWLCGGFTKMLQTAALVFLALPSTLYPTIKRSFSPRVVGKKRKPDRRLSTPFVSKYHRLPGRLLLQMHHFLCMFSTPRCLLQYSQKVSVHRHCHHHL